MGKEDKKSGDGYEDFLASMNIADVVAEMTQKLDNVLIDDKLKEHLVREVARKVVKKMLRKRGWDQEIFDLEYKPIIVEALNQINLTMSKKEISKNWLDQIWFRFNIWLNLPSSLRANTTFA